MAEKLESINAIITIITKFNCQISIRGKSQIDVDYQLVIQQNYNGIFY